jgi:eukaryotic-like serine/threonine-protein kinase
LALITDGDTAANVEIDPGRLAGTPPYMSPERATGDSLASDTLSDVYALGVILDELLAGKRPNDIKVGSPTATVFKIVAIDSCFGHPGNSSANQ